jgi:dienelactone hydrolase|tara:strand:- start:558 stop:2837 length:2280 start_codon:yes stop_codon:yes gene_type:complete
MDERINSLFEKLKKSTIVKVVSGYAVIAFITVQVASLVNSSFGFGEEFMQNIILGFFVVFPFIALVAWAASSRFSTLKILGISFLLLFTGYGTGSFIWVNNFILPGLEQNIAEDNYVEAWLASNKINSFAPFLSKYNQNGDELSSEINLSINQDGAKVSWRPYENPENKTWRILGSTPLNPQRLPNGVLQIKLEKDGFITQEFSLLNPGFRFANTPFDAESLGMNLDPINLQANGTVPQGMIYIQGGNFIPALLGGGIDPVFLHPFYIDQFEVTNKDFKLFIDSGGYENNQFWVDMDFIKDGTSLSWDEAKKVMIDSTGLQGPANWEVGTYLEGGERLPVTGISWYEALAYARYKGNILPPMYHWIKAAFPPAEIVAPISSQLLKNSNFSQKAIKEVGNGPGANGTFDMAGNAREWVWNIFGGRGLAMGGGYTDPQYSATQNTPLARMNRSSINGFRTARLINPRDLNPFGDPINRQEPKPLSFYKPMSDEVFKVYSRNYEVNEAPLNIKEIYADDSHPVWIKERVQIDVGYNNEKMDVLVFKPKGTFQPTPSVIVYPGANYFSTPPEIDDINPGEFGLDFIIKSGRTLVWPAWKGSLDRMTTSLTASPEERLRNFRELLRYWTVDTHKTLDYLETRQDMDSKNFFYLGMSYGSIFTTHTLLFEDRYNAALLYVGGAVPTYPPMSDGINHLPRIKTPFLMLNGEDDYLVPKSSALTLYNFSGTPEEDKKIIFYNSGHWPLPRNQMIKESLATMEEFTLK